MRVSALTRLAVAGTKTDRVRVTMTALGTAVAVVAWLSAATVATLGVAKDGASDPRYTTDVISQPGLRGGVIATFVLLTIPVLGLVAQSARLGAPARDRRIASIRLAGATPRQATAIGAGESGVAAVMGSALGLGAYFALRRLLDHPDRYGARAIPTDVIPPASVIAIICIMLPVVVMLVSAWLLRTATTSPLGVVLRVRRADGPSALVGLLLIAGVALFAGFAPLTRLLAHHDRYIPDWIALLIFYVGVMLAAIGVSVGAGWITYATGRILRRLGSSPASRIAGGRMVADPWQGSRAFGVMIIAVMFAGVTAGVYQNFAVMEAVQAAGDAADARAAHDPSIIGVPETFYTNTTRLVAIAVGVAAVIGALGLLLSLTETIVSRRRTYAALVATGVPRSVLVRTQLWQTMAMAIPALLIAAGTGAGIARALFGGSQSRQGDQYTLDNGLHVDTLPTITRSIPIPWAGLGLIVGGSLAAVLVAVGIGLLFLKPSTSVEELRTA